MKGSPSLAPLQSIMISIPSSVNTRISVRVVELREPCDQMIGASKGTLTRVVSIRSIRIPEHTPSFIQKLLLQTDKCRAFAARIAA